MSDTARPKPQLLPDDAYTLLRYTRDRLQEAQFHGRAALELVRAAAVEAHDKNQRNLNVDHRMACDAVSDVAAALAVVNEILERETLARS